MPNEIFQVAAIPRTLSGKKMELPVKKLLMGADPASVLKRDAMANADSVDWFIALARDRLAGQRMPAAPATRRSVWTNFTFDVRFWHLERRRPGIIGAQPS